MSSASYMDFSNEDEIENGFSSIKDYFKNKSIFLTGGTGFLGLLYIQKLLRSDVKMIYLLVRPKKNIEPIDRIKTLCSDSIFDTLYKYDRNFIKRIHMIHGDMSKIKLGLSDEDLEVIYNNVDIVLHAAAEVRFDEKLVKTLLTNLRGTRELLRLCEKMKNFQVLTYISTAYSNCYRKVCYEKIYNISIDPNIMIKIAEKIADNENMANEFEILTNQLIKPFPNTYTFSKCLSEMLISQYANKLRICIIRPSIVISTHEDPIPAWCNNIYGLNGVVFAIGGGLLRLIPTKPHTVGDVVCADYVINSTLAALWYMNNKALDENSNKIENPEVFHVNTSTDTPVTYGNIRDSMKKEAELDPPFRLLWKICVVMTTCGFMLKYLTIWYHIIPSIIFDCFFVLTNKKIRTLPIYRKIERFMDSLKYFMKNEWNFDNSNMKRVWDSMSSYDQKAYPSDVRKFNWSAYAYLYCIGVQKYLSHSTLNTRKIALRNYKRLVISHYVVLCFYYGIHILGAMAIASYFNIPEKLATCFYETIVFLRNPN